MAHAQVNARVSAEIQEILEAAAYAQRKAVGEVVRPAIEQLAQELAEVPAVKTALRARKEMAAADAAEGARADHPTGEEASG